MVQLLVGAEVGAAHGLAPLHHNSLAVLTELGLEGALPHLSLLLLSPQIFQALLGLGHFACHTEAAAAWPLLVASANKTLWQEMQSYSGKHHKCRPLQYLVIYYVILGSHYCKVAAASQSLLFQLPIR
jgi:hypothetical protein